MTAEEYKLELDFRSSPTLCDFLGDLESFVRVVVGPVGSGKTVACCAELFRIASMQMPHPRDNVRYSRFAVIRNTSPELKSTTINTWLEHYPEQACGPLKYTSPIEHRIITPRLADGTRVDMQVYFIPLDKPQDVRKLRSLELTAAYINEVSEVPRAVLTMARRRINRFPKKIKQATMRRLHKDWIARWGKEYGEEYHALRVCLIGDSNTTDDDHWFAEVCKNPPDGWSIYKQPPAVLEVARDDRGRLKVVEPPPWNVIKVDPGAVVLAAGRMWVVNPHAENLDNLGPGYYGRQQLPGSRLNEIRRDVQAKWVYVADGQPVVPGFNDDFHVFDELPVLKGVPLELGLDIGGGTLQPAAVIAQRHPLGIWLIHREVIGKRIGAMRFTTELLAVLQREFPGIPLKVAWADPMVMKPDELLEVVIADHMVSRGIPVEPAPSNRIGLRVEAWEAPMTRVVDDGSGRMLPGIMISSKCVQLRKALSGAWFFRRMQVPGQTERYHDTPDKSHPYSDLGDAGGYLLLGGGEHRTLTSGQLNPPPATGTVVAPDNFDVFA